MIYIMSARVYSFVRGLYYRGNITENEYITHNITKD